MPPLEKGAEGTGETSQTERAEVVRLIDDRVLRQGNFFIKSFLRDRELRIGTKKEEFRQNLLDGFDSKVFSRQDLDAWLVEVDGWGAQRVYLFRVPRTLVAKRLRNTAHLHKLRPDVDPSTELPDRPSLACATYEVKPSGGRATESLRLSWCQRATEEIREKKKDREEKKGRTWYRFKAFRVEELLRIFRFEARLDLGLAALFVPSFLVWPEGMSLDQTIGTLATVLDFDMAPHRIAISNVVKKLDQAEAETGGAEIPDVSSESTRLRSRLQRSYVQFVSMKKGLGVGEVGGPVLETRLAIKAPQLEEYHGERAQLEFLARPNGRVSSDVVVFLDGDLDEVLIKRRLTATDVWAIFALLRAYA